MVPGEEDEDAAVRSKQLSFEWGLLSEKEEDAVVLLLRTSAAAYDDACRSLALLISLPQSALSVKS